MYLSWLRKAFQHKRHAYNEDISPPIYITATKGSLHERQQMNVPQTSTWSSQIRSAMSYEDFSEYFVANYVRQSDSIVRNLLSSNQSLDVDLIDGPYPSMPAGTIRTQIGELKVRIRINPNGLCFREPMPSAYKVYVLWVGVADSDALKQDKLWINIVRKVSPNAPIIVCHHRLENGAVVDGPCSDKALKVYSSDLATIYLDAACSTDESSKLWKVITRCAILQALEAQTENIDLNVDTKRNFPTSRIIPSYVYKSWTPSWKE